MIQEIQFLTMDARDSFLHQVNKNFCKDFFGLGLPVEHIRFLGGGGSAVPGTRNSTLASLDLSKVSDPVAVGQLVQFFGGKVRLR